jgi:hypothetical protein
MEFGASIFFTDYSHGGAPRGPIAGGLYGGRAPHFAMGGPHGCGGTFRELTYAVWL